MAPGLLWAKWEGLFLQWQDQGLCCWRSLSALTVWPEPSQLVL